MKSLEGEGARAGDDAFAGSGVEKPKNLQGLLNEEKEKLIDETLGQDGDANEDGVEAGEQAEGEEEEGGDGMTAEERKEMREEAQEEWDDCMTQLKAFISYFQVGG